MREIILDTETTGLDPAQGHRIIEIGCVEMVDGRETGNTWQTYLNPERPVEAGASAVSGLTDVFLSDKPVFSEKVEEFLDFIKQDILVAHNAMFDLGFVNAELSRLGMESLPASRVVDTLAIARQKLPGSPASLDALCRRFDVDLSGREKHGALLDARLLARVYQRLVPREDQLTMMAALESPAQENQAFGAQSWADLAQGHGQRSVTAHTLTPEEAERHARFLEQIKEPIWRKKATG